MMDLKIHLKVVKGRWYISLGKKGYKSTYELNAALSEWIRGDEANVSFTTDKTDKSVLKVVIRQEDKWFSMDVYDPNSGEFIRSVKQCPKIFSDYMIENEFYINYD